ncbi:oxidoreductase short chain dehydrogenase/reductase family protein [Anaeramoeba ignava]|uniref:Oxidoreductase short chain dehydrogenase/reductase family protein n=1 Tax=Anaeramoeba ignava TaxID=1746090 RepID=A0A9Q0LK72_ANAIG|nr:oxidoreductase short chain dehydrogenase/reductase family protein [Anaeramoeba ignava]
MISTIITIAIIIYFFLKAIPLIYTKYMVNSQNLKRKYNTEWVFITGGSSGLGKELAMKFAEQGMNLVILSRTKSKLEQAKNQILDRFPNIEIRIIAMDFGLPVEQIEEQLIPQISDIDVKILINNIGYMLIREFQKRKWENIQSHINAHITSAIKLSQIIAQKLIQSNSKGAICFTSSMGCFYPIPYIPIYSGAKAYLQSFASTLAIELKPFGIDVHVVIPGPIPDTDFYDRTGLERNNPFFENPMSKFINQNAKSVAKIYLKTIGSPFVVVDTSLFVIFSRILENFLSANGLVWIALKSKTAQSFQIEKVRYD